MSHFLLQKVPKFLLRIQVSDLNLAENCVNVARKCVNTLWLQHVLVVYQLLPSPLRSVSASLVLGLPKIAFRLPSEAGVHARLAHAVGKQDRLLAER